MSENHIERLSGKCTIARTVLKYVEICLNILTNASKCSSLIQVVAHSRRPYAVWRQRGPAVPAYGVALCYNAVITQKQNDGF